MTIIKESGNKNGLEFELFYNKDSLCPHIRIYQNGFIVKHDFYTDEKKARAAIRRFIKKYGTENN